MEILPQRRGVINVDLFNTVAAALDGLLLGDELHS